MPKTQKKALTRAISRYIKFRVTRLKYKPSEELPLVFHYTVRGSYKNFETVKDAYGLSKVME